MLSAQRRLSGEHTYLESPHGTYSSQDTGRSATQRNSHYRAGTETALGVVVVVVIVITLVTAVRINALVGVVLRKVVIVIVGTCRKLTHICISFHRQGNTGTISSVVNEFVGIVKLDRRLSLIAVVVEIARFHQGLSACTVLVIPTM